MKQTTIATVALVLFSPVAAATDAELPEIVVKGQLFASERSPFSVNAIEQETIRDRQVSRMQDLFREIPGIAVRELGLGGVADSVTMRGFSSGSHGGDIGMAIDGIPLNEAMSHADGYADQNVIIPLEVERMTVFKGPSSALYGNYNRAGTVSIESRKGGDYREIDVKAGSFSTLDVQVALGARSGPTQGNFAAQLDNTNGFRQQSATRRGTVSGRLGFDLGSGSQIAISGRVHEGKWDSASYITGAQNEDEARRFNKDARTQHDGGKTFTTGRVDLSTPLSPDTRFLMFAYATQQTFNRYFSRPTSAILWEQRLEHYGRGVRSAGGSLNGLSRPAGKDLNWVIGAEAYYEDTRYVFKDALNNRRETGMTTGGRRPYLDRNYTTRSISGFGRAEWNLAPTFRPALGLRHDRLAGDCAIRGIEIAAGLANPCQAMTGYAHTSPKLGVRSTWSPKVDPRASISEGFHLPPAGARYGPGGNAVKPTRIRQLDTGLTLKPFKGAVTDVAVFRIDTNNEVWTAGDGNFENFGKTRREGVEVDVQFSPTTNRDLSAALTLNNARVVQHADASIQGKAIPGVPARTATLRGHYRFGAGWSADLALQHMGGFPVNADNSATMRGYTTADLAAAWERRATGRRQRVFVVINNLADRAYTTSSLISGGIQLYDPAPPRGIVLGFSCDI